MIHDYGGLGTLGQLAVWKPNPLPPYYPPHVIASFVRSLQLDYLRENNDATFLCTSAAIEDYYPDPPSGYIHVIAQLIEQLVVILPRQVPQYLVITMSIVVTLRCPVPIMMLCQSQLVMSPLVLGAMRTHLQAYRANPLFTRQNRIPIQFIMA
ncbi:hypothetical protein BJV78DRAFT_590908 [Lactifluus subvellereus]|nr:hypothetical protein BJV78DRAFT_590908 [Lactifluus subvellereus]